MTNIKHVYGAEWQEIVSIHLFSQRFGPNQNDRRHKTLLLITGSYDGYQQNLQIQ